MMNQLYFVRYDKSALPDGPAGQITFSDQVSIEPLAKFIERGGFSLCSRGRSGRRSGRRGPELRDAEYLIDRECHHAEHEVAFDLDRAAHAHGPCAEFILQSGVDAFGQGAKIKNDVVRIGHMDEFHAL